MTPKSTRSESAARPRFICLVTVSNEVVAGNLPAGRPLREGELAERFGVSRGPIRDAFLQRREFLVNDGQIEEDPFLDDLE